MSTPAGVVHRTENGWRKSAPPTTTFSVRNLGERLDRRGVARIYRHSYVRGQADRAVARGEAVRILPGVVAASAVARDPRIIIRALLLWHRDIVLVGKAALIMLGMKAPGTTRPMDFYGVKDCGGFLYNSLSHPAGNSSASVAYTSLVYNRARANSHRYC